MTIHGKYASPYPAPASARKGRLPAPLKSAHDRGTKVAKTAANKLPHERDESVEMTGGIGSETVQQAYRDITDGLQDTDRGAEADRTYQKQKR